MSVLTGPLFSLTASGTVGKALTYSHWRGRQYVRTRVIPRNPRSAEQVSNRNAFTNLSRLWTQLPAEFQDTWTVSAKGRPLTNRNLMVKANLSTLEFNDSWLQVITSPGSAPAGALTAPDILPGAGVMTFTADELIPPAGYDFDQFMFLAWPADTWDPPTYPVVTAATDPANPPSFDLTLPVGVEVIASFYARLIQNPVVEPTNQYRYTPSFTKAGTPT